MERIARRKQQKKQPTTSAEGTPWGCFFCAKRLAQIIIIFVNTAVFFVALPILKNDNMEENSKINLIEIKATPKIGTESLTHQQKNVGYTLLEFWQWSASDILTNTTRGRFAEFIVGTAVRFNPKELRNEWDAFDIKTLSGIKIEIKSAAYIQSWGQRDYSKISFSIRKTRHGKATSGRGRGEAKRHADIYVFCLLKTKEAANIDPLKLEQWDFFVLPTYKIDNNIRSQNAISLNSLQRLAKAISYGELKTKIDENYKAQCEYIANL
jgi:hypothetical protein